MKNSWWSYLTTTNLPFSRPTARSLLTFSEWSWLLVGKNAIAVTGDSRTSGVIQASLKNTWLYWLKGFSCVLRCYECKISAYWQTPREVWLASSWLGVPTDHKATFLSLEPVAKYFESADQLQVHRSLWWTELFFWVLPTKVHPPSASLSSLYRHQFLSRDTVSKYSPDGENSICVKKVWSKSAIIFKQNVQNAILFLVKKGTKL